MLGIFDFDFKVASKLFSKMLPMTNSGSNSFQSFASLSQKTVSTLSLKNLQKTEKCQFPRFRTFVFQLKVASKPASKIL